MNTGIIKNLTWLTVGTALTKPAWLWYTIILLTGTLGEASYGVLNAALALMLVASGLTNLGSGRYVVREIARHRERASSFFSNFFLLQLGLVVVVLSITIGIGTQIGYTDSKLAALFFAGVYAMSMALTVLCRAFFNAFEQMQWVSVSTMVEKLLVIAFGTVFVMWHASTASALAGMAIGMVLTLVGNVVFMGRHLATFEVSQVRVDFLKTHVVRAMPLGLIGFFTVIYFRTDQIMVEAIAGEEANGQYSLAYRLIEAALLLPVLLSQVLYPRFSALHHKDETGEFKILMQRGLSAVTLFALAAALVLFFFADPIIDLIRLLAGSADFVNVSAPLRVLAWTLPFMAVNGLLCIVMTAKDDQNVLAIGFGVAALLNIVMNLALIPTYGPVGAAIATLSTEGLVTVGLVYRHMAQNRKPGADGGGT